MKHLIRELRDSTGMTQKEFAEHFNIPLSTLRKWEQGETSPAGYVVDLIEKSLPSYRDGLLKILGEDEEIYFLDYTNKIAYDQKGNSVSFSENPKGVMERNLPVYLRELFSAFYDIQNKFNSDLRYDKIEKIDWSRHK